MSVSQYQNQVNSLDKEIADLEKKKAAIDKECAKLQSNINSTSKSITKHTSASTAASKMKQIGRYESDYAKKSSNSAELGKKIAEKRKKCTDTYLKLQKAQQEEQKKQNRESKKLQSAYENKIAKLEQQVNDTYAFSTSHDSSDQQIEAEEYDVFISHAFEDKASFVNEFVDELKKQGLKVWYDTDAMKWGDSMRERIDKGLAKSKYGVVILSPNYIADNKYWTKAELNGLFQMETINGKTILPVWHELTKKQVTEYSPIIADRKAMTTANMTAAEIAVELKNLFCDTDADEE